MFTALKLVSSILPLLPKNEIKCKPGPHCSGADVKQAPEPAGDLASMPPPPPGQNCDHYKTCGLPAAASPLNGTVPNVLIIGDSISESGSGYGPLVKTILERPTNFLGNCSGCGGTGTGRCNAGQCLSNASYTPGALAVVHHSGGWNCLTQPSSGSYNCSLAFEQSGNSCHARTCLPVYLGAGSWDVISFNAGIHDCLVKDDQKVTEANYKANILAIYEVSLKKLAPGGTFLWTTTTPVVPRAGDVTPGCVEKRNAIAASALSGKPQVKVNDLYGNISAVCGTNYTIGACPLQIGTTGGPGGMHFNSAGRQFTALVTARSIAASLGPAWARINCTLSGMKATGRCSGWSS